MPNERRTAAELSAIIRDRLQAGPHAGSIERVIVTPSFGDSWTWEIVAKRGAAIQDFAAIELAISELQRRYGFRAAAA
ncbi:MAG: hypothetical protein AB7O56_11610 [Bauldia sp.]